MKNICFALLLVILAAGNISAQKRTPLPHGMVFGAKPSTVSLIPASRLNAYMDKRARVTAAIVGTVAEVTKSKGGWFTMKAGKGQVIAAHFKNYNINLPKALKGREVIISGKASKQFNAFDAQREAGDRRRNVTRPGTKQPISFEVEGLMVNK
ncbi:DUF4920 domain-containing protein [Mucilaginibacter sp. Bleaf8]|uniref:DUF4920 domain-containing protein n=1 Tax=Mucilaginibacter sp. Bleaf8 TaxID=2834430 RepID=UPI001BD091A2|nr:DUF4920 domain-containing protein [Mucilaginibacter sp. Bleaf8]MBS7565880.1 DUF4920 domain-containing protein [Mucilaginibacter sp. Bleaf8]